MCFLFFSFLNWIAIYQLYCYFKLYVELSVIQCLNTDQNDVYKIHTTCLHTYRFMLLRYADHTTLESYHVTSSRDNCRDETQITVVYLVSKHN